MNYLSPNDLVFYKNMDTKIMMSGGYNIQSILLANQYENTLPKNSSIKLNEGLILPAGLVYQPHKWSVYTQSLEKNMGNYENNENLEDAPVLENDIYDKLIELVKINPVSLLSQSKQTKRFRVREKKNKTRKMK